MDSSEEEFGEKRIATLAAKNRALSLPDLLALIERSVKNFHGEDHYADDFTLLAARILGD